MQYTRHALLIGLGQVGLKLLNALPRSWNIDVLDISEEALAKVPESVGGQPIRKFQGDACNRLVLEKTGIKFGSTVAVMTESDEINNEIVRVIRSHFKVEEIICLQRCPEGSTEQMVVEPMEPAEGLAHLDLRESDAHGGGHESVSQKDGDNDKTTISTLYTADIVTAAIRGEMVGDTIASEGLGIGKGEIRQVTVLGSSAAIGQKVLDFSSESWNIGAVFRNNELLLPSTNPTIEKGDTVLVLGDAEVLEHEVAFLRGGEIVFPNQYGEHIGAINPEKIADEVNWLVDRSHASEMVELSFPALSPEFHTDTEIRNRLGKQNIGILAIPPRQIPLLSRIGFKQSMLKRLLLASKIPVLIARNKAPYKRILLAVSKQDTAAMISTIAIDLARQCNATVTVLIVVPPNAGPSHVKKVEKLPEKIIQIARVHGIEVGSIIDEGNPIQKIREHARDVDLLVIGHSPLLSSSFFRPDVSLHILHDCPSSVLFVPWNLAKLTAAQHDDETKGVHVKIDPNSEHAVAEKPAMEE